MTTPAPIAGQDERHGAGFGVLAWRVLGSDGRVLREWTCDVLTSFAILKAEIVAVAPQDRRQRAAVLVSDPDGDLWPAGQWRRVLSLEPPW